jgi:hypothetical protein
LLEGGKLSQRSEVRSQKSEVEERVVGGGEWRL